MRSTRWLAAHWPGAQDAPGSVEDPGGEPVSSSPGTEPESRAVGAQRGATADLDLGATNAGLPDAAVAPGRHRRGVSAFGRRAANAAKAVARGVVAPVLWFGRLLRATWAWILVQWPGYEEELPPVYGPPEPAAVAMALAEAGEPQSEVAAGQPGERVETAIGEQRAAETRRRMPLFGLRQIGAVFHAVYAALADPIARADQETKERRAAQARKAGLAAASVALAVLLVYTIFPVRAFLHQWSATDRQQDRLDVLTEQNRMLEERVERLKTEEEIERLAREQHGLVYPDEDPVILLPAPED